MDHYPIIVVTGFGPFGDVLENSSSIVVRALYEKWREISLSSENGLKIFTDVQVSYNEVDRLSEKIWQEIKPDLVVHVGVSKASRSIHLETCSSGGPYSLTDVCGLASDVGCTHGKLATKLALLQPCSALQSAGFECCISEDAGNYLCSYIYHRSLERNPERSLFVHVPDLSEIFTPEYLGEALLILIFQLCQQCNLAVRPQLADYFLRRTIRAEAS